MTGSGLSGRAVRTFGAGWSIAFYFSYYGLPALIGFPAIAGEAAIAGVAVGYLRSRSAREEWSAPHWIALIAGALTPALVFDAFQVSTLETAVVIVVAAALLRLSRRAARPSG